MASQITSLTDGAVPFIYIQGRMVRVWAIAKSVEEANVYLEFHHGQAVICEGDGLVFIADYGDKGKRVKL